MADQPNILFVDDEDSIRLTLPPLLQSYGFEVTSAATVAEALGLITRHKFDVLTLTSISVIREMASLWSAQCVAISRMP